VTTERISRWRASADQMHMTLEEWIISNLDSAAELVELGATKAVRRIDSLVREIGKPVRQLDAAASEASDR
jgi:hypothetical protein